MCALPFLQRDLDSFFWTRRRDATDRVRRAFGDVGRAVDRIHGNVERWRTGIPGAELFSFENARRFVLHPFADHDFAADVYELDHAAYRVARAPLSRFLLAGPWRTI